MRVDQMSPAAQVTILIGVFNAMPPKDLYEIVTQRVSTRNILLALGYSEDEIKSLPKGDTNWLNLIKLIEQTAFSAFFQRTDPISRHNQIALLDAWNKKLKEGNTLGLAKTPDDRKHFTGLLQDILQNPESPFPLKIRCYTLFEKLYPNDASALPAIVEAMVAQSKRGSPVGLSFSYFAHECSPAQINEIRTTLDARRSPQNFANSCLQHSFIALARYTARDKTIPDNIANRINDDDDYNRLSAIAETGATIPYLTRKDEVVKMISLLLERFKKENESIRLEIVVIFIALKTYIPKNQINEIINALITGTDSIDSCSDKALKELYPYSDYTAADSMFNDPFKNIDHYNPERVSNAIDFLSAIGRYASHGTKRRILNKFFEKLNDEGFCKKEEIAEGAVGLFSYLKPSKETIDIFIKLVSKELVDCDHDKASFVYYILLKIVPYCTAQQINSFLDPTIQFWIKVNVYVLLSNSVPYFPPDKQNFVIGHLIQKARMAPLCTQLLITLIPYASDEHLQAMSQNDNKQLNDFNLSVLKYCVREQQKINSLLNTIQAPALSQHQLVLTQYRANTSYAGKREENERLNSNIRSNGSIARCASSSSTSI